MHELYTALIAHQLFFLSPELNVFVQHILNGKADISVHVHRGEVLQIQPQKRRGSDYERRQMSAPDRTGIKQRTKVMFITIRNYKVHPAPSAHAWLGDVACKPASNVQLGHLSWSRQCGTFAIAGWTPFGWQCLRYVLLTSNSNSANAGGEVGSGEQ